MMHLFIINPAAGGKRSRHVKTAEEIRSVMRGHREYWEIYVTKAPMDACHKVRAASEGREPLRVYACGGDGTLNECVNGAVNRPHVSVTHYPTGTGNDFIKVFGPEGAPLFRSLPELIGGRAHPIDLIEVQTPSEVRYGVNICSVGIDARIGTDVHKYSAIPVIGGAAGYVVSLAVNFIRGINQHLAIRADDFSKEGLFALACACNGSYYGGGFNPVPDALPDDGVLEFLVVSAVTRLKFLSFVGEYAKGRFREISEIIRHIRGNHMIISGAEEFVINVDGEMMRAKDVTFRMLPGGVSFILPKNMHFSASKSIQFAAIKSK